MRHGGTGGSEEDKANMDKRTAEGGHQCEEPPWINEMQTIYMMFESIDATLPQTAL